MPSTKAEIPIDRAGEPPLIPGAPPPRRFDPWKLFFLVAILGGLTWAGVAVYSGTLNPGKNGAESGALLYKTSRNPLQVIVSAEGNVESASNLEVKCRVAGGSTILWIVEDGKIVEEGEEIVRLDTSAIEDKLNSQRIVYEKALATQIQSQESLEAAKITVKEYEEGTFLQLLKQVEAEIQIALENLRSSENQLKYSKRMVRKGFASSLQREADEFAVERAKLDLDAANTKKKVLVDFTKLKTLKDLIAKREAASAQLRSDQAGLQLEKARLDRLQDQLKNCVITAPKKGMVVYANDSDRGSRFGSSGPQGQVEEGSMVRESQALVRLPDLSKMRVKVTIHESRVDQIRAGMPALVTIQDQDYDGKVLSIANQPQPGSWYSARVKEYATTVSIDGDNNSLRPGMTAKVTILVDDVKDALTLPVSSVVEQKGNFFCWVKTPQGPQRRPLKLGRTNDKLIEVVDGVKEGEDVFRNPRAVVEESRQEPPFEKQSEDAKFSGDAALAGGQPPAAERQNGAPSGKAERGADDARPVPAVDASARPPVLPTSAAAGAAPAAAGRVEAEATPGESGAEPGAGAGRDSKKASGRGSFDLMQFDKDGDKKLSREELPERMQSMFERMDPNQDGFIDATEIAEMRRLKKGAGGRPGGRGAEGKGGPGGGPAGPGEGAGPGAGPGGEGPGRPPS